MTIEEIKKRISEIDSLLDDENTPDDEFDHLEKEARLLTEQLGKTEELQRLSSVPTVKANQWEKAFLEEFESGESKISIAQAYVLNRIGHCKPFQCDGKYYEWIIWHKSNFATLIATPLNPSAWGLKKRK